MSICIPVHNGGRFIGQTIASVLAQTLEDFEVRVIDNASTDDTVDVVSGFSDPRVKLTRNDENIGAVGNWNRALSLAEGDLFKLVCADDTLAPECLAEQVRALRAHDDVVLVAGQRDVVDEDGRVLLRARGLADLDGVVDGRRAVRATVRAGTNIFGEPACTLMRTALLDRCGPFSGARPYMIDLDYWCRMLRLGSLYADRRAVATFRVVGSSWSAQLAREQSRQAVDLLRELRRGDPASISAADLALGSTRAAALAAGRAASYRVLRWRR